MAILNREMIPYKKAYSILLLALLSLMSCLSCNEEFVPESVTRSDIVANWRKLTGNRKEAKVVYAEPPDMFVIYLHTGEKRKIAGIITAGGPGRIERGFTPRPSWSPDGHYFVYRTNNRLYVSDEEGNKRFIDHPDMDTTMETRWSWVGYMDSQWVVGPTKERNLMMINPRNPALTRLAYTGRNVRWHAEITGIGLHIVYFNGRSVYVTKLFGSHPGIKISTGQSCRPCAAPDDRVAWLPSPHNRYSIHDAETGKKLMDLPAPENEEIYRLNWSNHPDYAVHMFGSRGNNRMHVRRISTAGSVYIGSGWDPDLWIDIR